MSSSSTSPSPSPSSSPNSSEPLFTKPSGVAHTAYSMAAISTIGGLAGYLKGGSTRSLMAGIGKYR